MRIARSGRFARSPNVCLSSHADAATLFTPARPFYLLLGISIVACSGVFFTEHAHGYQNSELHPQVTWSTPNHRRAFASLCAAAVATMICVHQQHFTLSLTAPFGLDAMRGHRCGKVLIVCCAWCLEECAQVLLRSRASAAKGKRPG